MSTNDKSSSLTYKPPNSIPGLKPVTPTIGVRFANDSFLMKSYLDQHKIPYKIEDLEDGPFGLVLRIKRGSSNDG